MTERIAQLQLFTLKHDGCFEPMKEAAAKHGLPLAFVCAIASRETNCHNILGDFREGGYHGVGVMQIDIQHDIAREAVASGSWKYHPAPLIEFGCSLLAANRGRAYDDLRLAGDSLLRFTAAAYNAGYGGAERGHGEGGDCDRFTTGHDYGRDVMSRMAVFEKVLET